MKNSIASYTHKIMLEKKTQKISSASYHKVQVIMRLLQREVNYNKQHHINNYDDFDFSDFSNPEIDGVHIANVISDDSNILTATNWSVVSNPNNLVICYRDQNLYGYDSYAISDNSIPIIAVLDVMKQLVKLGRHGIYARIQKNTKLQNQTKKLEDKMDLIAR